MDNSHPSPSLVGAGAIFIDDIVMPDGRTYMGQVGGGVVHALMGAAVWGERPGLSAFVGCDLPPEVVQQLAKHLDTSGLVHLDIPQARAWQLFEWDGTRREVHRVKEVTPYVSGTQPHHLPESYRRARAFYLLQDFDGIRAWAGQTSGLTLWEPNQLTMLSADRAAFRAALQTCPVDVVSPNLEEARAIYGMLSPEALIDAMFEDGAQRVALRMGEQGSLVAERETGVYHYIGAVQVAQVVDYTGAGNTYCGALLCGLLRGKSLPEAAAMGAVAASFCIEAVGVLSPEACDAEERDRRYAGLVMSSAL